jgi:hypothetical protein
VSAPRLSIHQSSSRFVSLQIFGAEVQGGQQLKL